MRKHEQDKKVSVSSLEESGELTPLSNLDFEERPESPYGKHLRTITIEVFEKGQMVYFSDDKSFYFPNGALYGTKKEKGRK